METINGEWIMKGCDPSDPEVLQSPEDAISMIRKIGFLPLFSNAIPGFSVEEHVPADRWWTGDPITDPWEWRIILASHPDIAYGKFFHRAAGFISKDFFPISPTIVGTDMILMLCLKMNWPPSDQKKSWTRSKQMTMPLGRS